MKFDCRVPACVLMTHLVHLLVTPGRAGMLARMMPTVARTIGCARTGTLWEGRYELARQDPQRASIPLGPMRIGLLCLAKFRDVWIELGLPRRAHILQLVALGLLEPLLDRVA